MPKAYGYKVYYDKESKTWKYDDFKTELYKVPRDSTTSWVADLSFAKFYAETYNAGEKLNVVICKDCGESFVLPFLEREWLKERGLKPFKRCYECRQKRRKS